jgi:hypothetical protein
LFNFSSSISFLQIKEQTAMGELRACRARVLVGFLC